VDDRTHHAAEAASQAPPPLDLPGSFVTVVDIQEVAARPHEFVRYFEVFDRDDDASLLIYAETTDFEWAGETVGAMLALGGVDPDSCAGATLWIVDGGWRALDTAARRSHAVLTSGDGGWLPIARPVYGPHELDGLRRQAERHWGQRDRHQSYSYEAAIRFVVDRGWLSEFHARDGSVPEASMERIARALDRFAPPAPRLLHVGNFVGISLSYLLDWGRDRGATVFSVDPDIPHRGVEHPQLVVNDLLANFGLTERHLLICGFSLEKNFSNDSVVFEDYNPATAWAQEAAPEHVLPRLVDTALTFDGAFIDGNHDAAYLRRELTQLTALLAPGGLLVLDDVNEWWQGVRAIFDEATGGGEWPFEKVDADGRIGILRRR
jgi:hypothetical protein